MGDRDEIPERGVLIGRKSVPAVSGKLTDDLSPWDGEIYARVAAGTPADIARAADAAEVAFPSGPVLRLPSIARSSCGPPT